MSNKVNTSDKANTSDVDPKVIIDNIKDSNECAFHKDENTICSPKHIVKAMADYLGTNSKKDADIVEKMKDKMDCKSESCILKSPEFINFMKVNNFDHILKEFFKPEGPDQANGWLSNHNIDDVLEQLHKKFPDFLHIPYQMRDFEKIGTQLATIDMAQVFKDGKKSFGVVLNTDYMRGAGIHWYCLFGEKIGDEITIEYFNSSGLAPLPETQAWLHKTEHYLKSQLPNIKVKIIYSTGIRFQDDNHSCGVYCLMYIWLRLEGIKNNWFNSDNFNDAFMHKAREILFRDNK